MNTVTVRNLTIGEGRPKIIVPIVAKTREDIVKKAESFASVNLDMVEWRADFYEGIFDNDATLATLKDLRQALGDTPLLFTFRTKKEGGEKEIDMETYSALNKLVAESGNADVVDVEIFSGDEIVARNIADIHAAGVLVVGSNHDFFATPDKDELVSRLRKMQEMGADLPKIAVMPQSKADVLTLLSASNEMAEKYADRPIITMSMAGTGVISRLAGEVFGSSMTFGAVGQVSAPGQIAVESLEQVLQILHNSL